MKCFVCSAMGKKEEACAKLGTSKGNIFSALLGRKCWKKSEIYVCEKHWRLMKDDD